jgi:hypothetical protein
VWGSGRGFGAGAAPAGGVGEDWQPKPGAALDGRLALTPAVAVGRGVGDRWPRAVAARRHRPATLRARDMAPAAVAAVAAAACEAGWWGLNVQMEA